MQMAEGVAYHNAFLQAPSHFPDSTRYKHFLSSLQRGLLLIDENSCHTLFYQLLSHIDDESEDPATENA
jgi:hypothetical protein